MRLHNESGRHYQCVRQFKNLINEINSGLIALNTTLKVGTTIGIEAISGKAGKGGEFFTISGGEPGAGSESNDDLVDGADGGDAGSMGQMGPVTTGDTTVAGEKGSGGFTSSAGSEQGDGIGSRNGGDDFPNSGTDGIGGFGGGNDHWVESTLTSSDWANGMGGARGLATEAGAGGGGWGGGGGGGVNSTDGPFWTGGSGSGSFARQSVSTCSQLPMLFNFSGRDVSTNDINEQIILSFSIVSTGSTR